MAEIKQFSLKELRARRNYSQTDMAKKLGVSLVTYNKWENNLNNVTIFKLKAIAEALEVSTSDIFLG